MAKTKRWGRWVSSLLVVVVIIGASLLAAYLKPLPTLKGVAGVLPTPTTKAVSLPWPAYGESALGAVGYGVLAQTTKQTALPTASIAKILTALCVLRAKPLSPGQPGPTITLTQTDVDSYNKYLAEQGSVVKVVVGEQITEYQALEAMLLPSANNMAETLATWAFGSIANYNTYANNYAKTAGLSSMVITDPSGFLPTTFASAQDLTLLGEIAMQNPELVSIVGQKVATIPVVGQIKNVNALIGTDGIVGIKTGNSNQDAGAFLFAAPETIGDSSVTIVGTILGGPNLGTAMYSALPLIAAAKASFTSATILRAGQVVGSYSVPWQGQVLVVAPRNTSLTIWNGSPVKLSLDLKSLRGAHPANQPIGTVLIQNGSSRIAVSANVMLSTNVRGPSLWWRVRHLI